MTRDAKYYADLPYRRIWEWRQDDAEPYWVVRLAEIPEVVGDGATRCDAETALRGCLEDYVAYRLAEGLEVPESETKAATG